MDLKQARELNLCLEWFKFRYYLCSDPAVTDSEYDRFEGALKEFLSENPTAESGPIPWQTEIVDSANRCSKARFTWVEHKIYNKVKKVLDK